MSLKKKKNVMIISACMVISFILYQLYFFLTISEAANHNRIIPVFDHDKISKKYFRSDDDKFINNEGILKGVLYSHMPKYRPDIYKEFKCLKSEQKIPFENVNDDFCDCEDGTDEPSTSACVNGTFFCDTQHPKKVTINQVPSGKVNDGICDCCDGSDEWLHQSNTKLLSQNNDKHYRFYVSKCPNNCK